MGGGAFHGCLFCCFCNIHAVGFEPRVGAGCWRTAAFFGIPLHVKNPAYARTKNFCSMECEISKETAERVRREFQRALDSAAPPYELAKQGHFTDEEEAFIQKEVERLLFEPELPNAGDAERKIIKRLKKMSHASFW